MAVRLAIDEALREDRRLKTTFFTYAVLASTGGAGEVLAVTLIQTTL